MQCAHVGAPTTREQGPFSSFRPLGFASVAVSLRCAARLPSTSQQQRKRVLHRAPCIIYGGKRQLSPPPACRKVGNSTLETWFLLATMLSSEQLG